MRFSVWGSSRHQGIFSQFVTWIWKNKRFFKKTKSIFSNEKRVFLPLLMSTVSLQYILKGYIIYMKLINFSQIGMKLLPSEFNLFYNVLKGYHGGICKDYKIFIYNY